MFIYLFIYSKCMTVSGADALTPELTFFFFYFFIKYTTILLVHIKRCDLKIVSGL